MQQRGRANERGDVFSGRRMNQLDSKLVGLANGFAAGKGIHRKISAAIEIQGEPCGIGGN